MTLTLALMEWSTGDVMMGGLAPWVGSWPGSWVLVVNGLGMLI